MSWSAEFKFQIIRLEELIRDRKIELQAFEHRKNYLEKEVERLEAEEKQRKRQKRLEEIFEEENREKDISYAIQQLFENHLP